MAISYDNRKKSYDSMNDSQKQQYNDLLKNKGDDYIGNQYMKQYNQTNNNQQQTSNESNFNNQNGTNWQNQTQQPLYNKTEDWFYTWNSEWEKAENRKRLRELWADTFTEEEYTDFYKNQNNQVSPELDQSKFQQDPWKITVQEWTAQQTGRPDYQASSEARLNEMKGNLDHYFATSPRMFSDRETFNRVFEYNTRESEAQRQLLDSYWKRKEDMDKASTYTSWESINTWMKNWEITTDQLNLLKEYNPEAYRKWQQLQEDEIKKRIVNDIVPPTIEAISWKINWMIEALWIQAQDALDIEWIYNDTMTKVGAYQTLEDANRTVKEIEAITNKKTAIMNRYAASTWGTVSDALAAARMQKAIAPYNEQLQGLQYQYQDYSNLYSQKSATAYQAANVRALQANENQRIWNQKCQALGFATSALSYRTPEENKQLDLQYQQAMNDMSLLQQSRQNDLALYNAYATAKLNNQLQSELTDLSVTDPTQLRANLNNVLSSYYSQWGDIIQRPQSQVVDDVIAYAQKNGISVAQALRENFIEPLQWKTEYKNAIAGKYVAPTSTTSAWYSKITINWKDYLTMWWRIIDPATLWIGTWDVVNAKPYNLVSVETMENWIDAFSVGKNKGDDYWECWKFVNDYLVSIGVTDANNRYFGNETIDTRRVRCNTQTAAKWAVAVFDYGIISSDNKNHGHVAVVTQTYADWSFDVIESNYPWWWKVNKRHVEKNDANLQGFINYSLWASSSQWYNTQDPYSWVSRYTSTWKEINAGGWITSLEKSFDRWEKLTDTQRKDLYSAYWVDVSELNEQRERYMNYVETKQMVDSLLDVKDRAMKLKEWAEKDSNKNLKWIMDLSIAEDGLWFWNNLFTTDTTIQNIQEWKSLFDNLMSNAWFQKYLDMRDKWAQFWIMTDSEWSKVDNSVAPIKREQKDDLFIKNLNSMIEWYDQVLMQLWYDSAEWAKPETAEQVEITTNQWAAWSWDIITMVIDGQVKYSYDWWQTRH